VPDARAQDAPAVTAVNIVEIGGSPLPAQRDSHFEASLPVRVLQ